MSYPINWLIYNRYHNYTLIKQRNSTEDNIAFFEGVNAAPEVLEAKQWLEAIIKDKEPLAKPEQAFIVTKILDAVYKSADNRKEVIF